MILFAVLTCKLKSATKMLFLICFLETQATGQHRSLQVNYVFSTKTDIGPAWWWLQDEKHPSIMPYNPLITFSHEVTWPIKNKISPILQGLWQFKSLISLIPQSLLPPNLTGRWLIMNRTHPWCHMTLWPHGHLKSRDKLKALYVLFQKVYDHETLQGSHLWRGKITFNVTWISDDLVTRDHVTK